MPSHIRIAAALAERTADAYSAERYGPHWKMCALLLLQRGYTEREAEAILRSKYMRWAADAHDVANQEAIAWYLDDPKNAALVTKAAISGLVDETDFS